MRQLAHSNQILDASLRNLCVCPLILVSLAVSSVLKLLSLNLVSALPVVGTCVLACLLDPWTVHLEAVNCDLEIYVASPSRVLELVAKYDLTTTYGGYVCTGSFWGLSVLCVQ